MTDTNEPTPNPNGAGRRRGEHGPRRPMDRDLAVRVDEYLGDRYWHEDDVLQQVLDDTAERGPTIQVGREGGKLLDVLVRATGARRALEVGTLFGYSGIWIARALPDDGHLDTIELSDLHADAAEHWLDAAGVADKVTVHRGRGLDVLPTLDGPYDLAFVDADKVSYPQYVTLVLDRLRPGGTLVVDNTIRNGRIAEPGDADDEAVREMHDLLAARADVSATALYVRDGIVVAVKTG